MGEKYDRKAADRWVNEHSNRLSEVGNELELYYRRPNSFNHKTNNLMSLTHKTIDEQIEKIKSDNSVPEKSKQRRIAIWEDLRPEKPAVDSTTEADIKAWAKGELNGKGRAEKPAITSEDPSADIKRWANTHSQNNK
jgi:hypothetical protein